MAYENEMDEESEEEAEEGAQVFIGGKRFLVGLPEEDEDELRSIRTGNLLRDLIETAEVDEHTGEVIIRSKTFSANAEIIERFQSIEELRDFFEEFGFYPGPREEDLFGYGAVLTVNPWEVAAALEESNAAALFTVAEEKGSRSSRLPLGDSPANPAPAVGRPASPSDAEAHRRVDRLED